MKSLARIRHSIRPCTLAYGVLIFLTLFTWAVGRAGMDGLGVALLVLALALFKGHLVGDWFMGLQALRGIWRWVVAIWLLIPGGLIALAFTLAYRS
jgi:hypothetical protein